ncbi:serpin family protein [Natronorarus salvus]|uniref:serpin family protein n=1 Tax=Natronorarus salvus TaxID=3117733 RepID=UPI002F26BC3A
MNVRRRDLLTACALTVSPLAGCLGDDPSNGTDTDDRTPEPSDGADHRTPSEPVGPEVDDEILTELVAGNTRFAFDLFEWLVAEESGNLVVSPYSISIALAMTYAGARGETAEEMVETLRFTLEEETHEAFATLAHELADRDEEGEDPESDGDDDDELSVTLRVANALWGQEGYPFRDEFLDETEEYYGAGLTEMDFEGDPDGTREEINAWVEARTEELIEELLPEGSIDASTVLVLTNALYFRGDWATPFDGDETTDGEFTTLDGDIVDVPLMSHSETVSFEYVDLDGAQAIELPYVGGDLAMTLLVPDEGEFEAFEAGFTPDRLGEITGALEPTPGDLTMPNFEHGTEVSLPEALSELGMPSAFGSDADFSGMVDGGGLWIDDVIHESVVAVDEEGTEAAAATAVVMEESAPPEPEFEFVVDRPFLYLIRDRVTETVLFVGRVVDASEAQG